MRPDQELGVTNVTQVCMHTEAYPNQTAVDCLSSVSGSKLHGVRIGMVLVSLEESTLSGKESDSTNKPREGYVCYIYDIDLVRRAWDTSRSKTT